MRLIARPVVVVTALALAFAALAAPVAAQNAPKWARDGLAAWYAAFNAGDAQGVAAQYAAEAVLLPAGQPAVQGRAAIEAYQVVVHRDMKFACSGAFDGFQVIGGMAVGWGHDDCTETAKAGGAATKTRSRWMTVYATQADGKWMIVRDASEEMKP